MFLILYCKTLVNYLSIILLSDSFQFSKNRLYWLSPEVVVKIRLPEFYSQNFGDGMRLGWTHTHTGNAYTVREQMREILCFTEVGAPFSA